MKVTTESYAVDRVIQPRGPRKELGSQSLHVYVSGPRVRPSHFTQYDDSPLVVARNPVEI